MERPRLGTPIHQCLASAEGERQRQRQRQQEHHHHHQRDENSRLHDRDMIHAVQHLIEQCLLFYMDREECVACLERNANLKPSITRIVWDELEKSNTEFFAAYSRRRRDQLRGETLASTGSSTTTQPVQQENLSDNCPCLLPRRSS